MKTLKLKALKPHKYGTRHLTAGEEYDAPVREAVALMATKKAKVIKADKRAVAAPQAAPAAPAPSPPRYELKPAEQPPDIDSLRLQATQLGINIDGRWGMARLQSEIEQARSR